MLVAMLRFLLKPRWIAFTVFAVVVAGVCFRLAFWQLDRLDGRRYYNDLFRAGMTQAPEPVESLLAGPPDGPLSFRQVSATGRYDAAEETVLYGRPLDGRPGNHVLTPLVLDDGRAVIVDRGWVPFEPTYPPIAASAPPGGTVEITGLLGAATHLEESPAVQRDGDRITVLSRVDLEALQEQMPYELLPMYVTLRTQHPEQGDLPVPEPLPELTDGPHLGYALQWFAFGAIALIGWVILVRREGLDRRRSAAQTEGGSPEDHEGVDGA
jgi:cytochrome oxidase assembly protein ShyY1